MAQWICGKQLCGGSRAPQQGIRGNQLHLQEWSHIMNHLQCLSLQCLSLESQAKGNHFSSTPPWPLACRGANPQHIFSSGLTGSKCIPVNLSSLSSSLFLLLRLSLFPDPWFLPLSCLVPIFLCCLNLYSSEPMVILFQQGLDKLLQLTVFVIFWCVSQWESCCFLYFSTECSVTLQIHLTLKGGGTIVARPPEAISLLSPFVPPSEEM